MSAFSRRPAANPAGGTHTADDIKLHRDTRPNSIWSGAFGEAWELVKAKPVETLLLSFVWLMFSGGGSFNMPSGSSSNSHDSSEHAWDSASGISGAIFDTVGNLAARISAFEVALIGGIVALVLTFAVVGLVLGTLVRGGTTVFWLRHVRGQNASLNHTTKAVSFFVPLLLGAIANGVAVFFGVLALFIPGIIIGLGFSFLNQVVVDKNLSWSEGLRASWRLTDGYKLDLFLFSIVCGLLNFAGMLACCIGVVVTNAVVIGASVIVYDRVAEPGNAYLDNPPGPAPDESTW